MQMRQGGSSRSEAVSVDSVEPGAERGEHAGAPVVGCRSAEPNEKVGGAAIHGGTDELSDTESAGAEHVSLIHRDQFNSGGLGDLDYGQSPMWNVTVGSLGGAS